MQKAFATVLALFGDMLTPAAPGDVKVLGRPGELFQASLNSRVFSAYAQGPVYDEAENAFATPCPLAIFGLNTAGTVGAYAKGVCRDVKAWRVAG